MDRKERTLRALQGLPVDRPPMVFWHHFVGADMEKENFGNIINAEFIQKVHCLGRKVKIYVKSYLKCPF